MRILGIILIVLGALGLAYRGFSYTERQQIIDVGPIKASADLQKRVDVPPWLSGAAIGVGVLLLVVPGGGRRRR